jgi:hypothetical protein
VDDPDEGDWGTAWPHAGKETNQGGAAVAGIVRDRGMLASTIQRMVLALYLAFLGLACAQALRDWRRAWFSLIVCGVVQDPVRKLTPGQPVVVSFLVVGLFGLILVVARRELLAALQELSRRFSQMYTTLIVFLLVLLLAAMNGLFTYGVDKWKVPLVSLATYVTPLTAILLGYVWLQREEMMFQFLRFYALLTSIAMAGSLLEYFRVHSPLLGAVALTGDYIRYLPGIQIRMLSGFYRAPDIMALHAAILTCVGIMMALRAGMKTQLLFWYGVAGFGFLTCVLAGRRKAIYFIAVFCAAFLWRFISQIRPSQLFVVIGIAVIVGVVLQNISANEGTSMYAQGAVVSQIEIAQRLEGGTIETLRQFGLMGAGLGTATQGVRHLLGTDAGLGTATQGVRHLLGTDANVGWQEGGLAKLAIEVGLPGILTIFALAWIVSRLWLRLTAFRDVEGSSQFLRVSLFAFVVANGVEFLASAQAYSDAVLALLAGFLVGCLFASATLDERLAASRAAAAAPPQQLTSPAPA